MPDLHRVLTCTCPSNFDWARSVESSDKKRTYLVTFTKEGNYACTCPGFKYRGQCRHIDEVSPERCGGLVDAFANTIYNCKTCPDCGEETIPFYVGV
jgi:hypothetical protein